ncbi:hypothetical protein VTO42DRAFT_7970 [Malbranchea cinnamomea]
MANTSEIHNYCLSPFLPEVAYPSYQGGTSARWCKDMPISDTEAVSCCLPCPAARWRYDEALEGMVNKAAWSAIPILALVVFIIASHLVLPVEATGRHFITTSATVGFVIFQLAWIIPLGSEPEMCRDDITAHDLRSDLRCAFSGASILFGVWIVILSCFCGALFLHLTVCWEKSLGRKFMIFSLIGIFGGSTGFLALVLAVTGVSYQFSKTCIINWHKSKPTFWGPLLGFSAATFVIELVTVVYCIYMITKPLLQDRKRARKGDFSISGSSFEFGRRLTARAASRRVRRVLELQWRVIAVVVLVLFHVSLLCAVFIQVANLYEAPIGELVEWLSCLALKKSQKECVHLADGHGPHQNFLIGAILLLVICPFWNFLVLIHRSTFSAWFNLLRGKRPEGTVRRGFLGGGGSRQPIIERDTSAMSRSFASPIPVDAMPLSVLESQKIAGWQSPTPDDRHRVASPAPAVERQYRIPKQSFSAPGRPRFSDEESDKAVGYYNRYPSYGTHSSASYQPQDRY